MSVQIPKDGYAWNPLRDYPRNQQCFCGSKAKFKKCCSEKLARVVKTEDAEKLKQYMKATRENQEWINHKSQKDAPGGSQIN